MQSLFFINIKMATKSLQSTRWRSLLTMLGVVIGVASVVTIVSIGEGIKHQIITQLNHFGSDLITIRPGNIQTTNTLKSLNSLTVFSVLNDASTLSNSDLQTISGIPGVRLAVPLAIVPGAVQINGGQQNNLLVIGTTAELPGVLNQSIGYGAFFGAGGNANAYGAVLGQSISNHLYPGEIPLGHSFSFHGQTFVIDGIFSQFDIAPLSIDANFNNVVFIPYTEAEQISTNSAPLYEILVKPTDPSQTSALVQRIKTQLLAANGGIQNFSVLTQNTNLQAASNILNLLTDLISGIAAISLLVGGIGIMNIMLVAVTERTQEIGIRKALGATNNQIFGQFVTEAVVLSFFGGVVGVIVSLLANAAIRITTTLTPLISWQIMLVALFVSLGVGILFGITPALSAARKDPIESLRYQ
jgi:putative ABC transport system permease protein